MRFQLLSKRGAFNLSNLRGGSVNYFKLKLLKSCLGFVTIQLSSQISRPGNFRGWPRLRGIDDSSVSLQKTEAES